MTVKLIVNSQTVDLNLLLAVLWLAGDFLKKQTESWHGFNKALKRHDHSFVSRWQFKRGSFYPVCAWLMKQPCLCRKERSIYFLF